MRQIIISLIGVAILALGYVGMITMKNKENPTPEKEERILPRVFTQSVANKDIPITLKSSGNLAARDRIDLYAEVQGIFRYSDRPFKPGIYFKEGEVLLQLDSDEYRANLRAQKSSLYNQLVALLPDLRFDYPGSFDKWQQYINNFSVDSTLPSLPSADSDQEKLFIAGRNIQSLWYNIKNMEERLSKYTLYAPYNGILTTANIDKGALVRSGQLLGSFINPNIYELEVAVNAAYADQLKPGARVTLYNIERDKQWDGKISRINSLINPSTQTIQVFINVSGKGLREGMYLEADLIAQKASNSFEISRKLLVENNKVYVLKGDVLTLQEVEPLHFTEQTAIVSGLADGTVILKKMLPGAYDGIQVNATKE